MRVVLEKRITQTYAQKQTHTDREMHKVAEERIQKQIT
jgi:hypothetical protein